MSLANDESLTELIALAKREDLGRGDITSGLLEHPHEPALFRLVAKQCGVFAGREIALPVLHAYDPSIEIDWTPVGRDGACLAGVPVELATLRGPVASLLAAERVLLNFLQRLSGVATRTRSFVDVVAGTGVTILDTRKTLPGWRSLDRYAVRCGGGSNHRSGLHDALLIKDNHVPNLERQRLAGAVFALLNRLETSGVTPTFIEVEVQSPAEVEQLLKVVGIDIILLDNFGLADLRTAVKLREDAGLRGKIMLEASGGVDLTTVRAVAETGVERISVGAITHSAPALDLALERE